MFAGSFQRSNIKWKIENILDARLTQLYLNWPQQMIYKIPFLHLEWISQQLDLDASFLAGGGLWLVRYPSGGVLVIYGVIMKKYNISLQTPINAQGETMLFASCFLHAFQQYKNHWKWQWSTYMFMACLFLFDAIYCLYSALWSRHMIQVQ